MLSKVNFVRITIAAAIIAAAATVIYHRLQTAERAALERVRLEAYESNRRVHILFETARTVLDSISEYIEVNRDGEITVNWRLDSFLDRATGEASVIRGAIVQDISGLIIAAGAPRTGVGMYLGDLDYFQAEIKADAKPYEIGAPFVSKIFETTLIPVARAIRDLSGKTIAVASVGIPITQIQLALAPSLETPDARSRLWRSDGVLLVSSQDDNVQIGVSYPNLPLFSAKRAGVGGTFIAHSPLTNETRLSAWRDNFVFPFFVSTGANRAALLARDRMEAFWTAAAASILLGLLLLVSIMVERDRRQMLDAQAQLRLGQRLSLVARNTRNLVVIADNRGRIEWVNKGFERVTGWQLEEVRGKRPGEFLVGPLTDPATAQALRTAVREKRAIRDISILNYKKNGETFWNDLEILPVFDPSGAHTGYVALQEDSTDRRRKDYEVKELNDRIALATAGSGIGIWSIDLGARQTHWDETVRMLLDVSTLEAEDKRSAFASRIVPEDSGLFSNKLRTLARVGQSFEYVFRIKIRNGSLRYLQIKGQAQSEVNGKVIRVLGTLLDVTESKTLEAGLTQARLQAEASNRAKSEFLAMMSHELRTPLNAIIGFSEIIEGEYIGPVGNSRYRSYATDIRNSGHLLLSMISGILDFSRIDAGRIDGERERVDLQRLVSDVSAILVETVSHQGHSLDVSMQNGLEIDADPLLIKQLILNLVTNSAKYTDRGGSIHVTGERRRDGAVALKVSDNGVGMEPEAAERAFEPFVRLHTLERSNTPGLGLGLAIVKRIVAIHGAKLTIDTHPGKGTTVCIVFPV